MTDPLLLVAEPSTPEAWGLRIAVAALAGVIGVMWRRAEKKEDQRDERFYAMHQESLERERAATAAQVDNAAASRELAQAIRDSK